jgi:hypothetical protein
MKLKLRLKRGNTKLASALAALAATGALIAGAVAMSGCGASATLDPIARAAEVSSRQAGAKIAMTMRFSAPALGGGANYTITAGGSFDEKARSGEMTMDLSGVPGLSALPGGGGNGQIQMIFLYPIVYMNMPFLAGRLPEGKTWMKLDVAKAASAAGIDTSSLSSLEQSDPTRFLDYLRSSSGGVVSLGGATVDGVPTTHYSATLQLSHILASLPGSEQAAAKAALEKLGAAGAGVGGVGGIPVNVWVDAQSRVRRIQMAFSGLGAAAGAAAGASLSMTIDFTSYGPVPPVVPPPASQVFDASAMVAAGIQSGAGG